MAAPSAAEARSATTKRVGKSLRSRYSAVATLVEAQLWWRVDKLLLAFDPTYQSVMVPWAQVIERLSQLPNPDEAWLRRQLAQLDPSDADTRG